MLTAKDLSIILGSIKRKYNKSKKVTLTQLKRKAPGIPVFTCSYIDKIIDKVGLWKNKKLTAKQAKKIIKELERLRHSNDKLREGGQYWYNKCKELFFS